MTIIISLTGIYSSCKLLYTKTMNAKNLIALLFIFLGAFFSLFPDMTKIGLWKYATDPEIAILVFLMWMTAIILYYLPKK